MSHKGFRRSRKDYPKGVIGIYDNGGKTADRYTVVFEPEPTGDQINPSQIWPYLGMSERPSHPQGFGQHGESKWRITRGLGEKTIDFADLPQECQCAVMRDLAVEP